MRSQEKPLNTFKKSFLAMMMNKKGQLGIIEMKFFFIGLAIGLILALVLVALMNGGIIPFKLPLISC